MGNIDNQGLSQGQKEIVLTKISFDGSGVCVAKQISSRSLVDLRSMVKLLYCEFQIQIYFSTLKLCQTGTKGSFEVYFLTVALKFGIDGLFKTYWSCSSRLGNIFHLMICYYSLLPLTLQNTIWRTCAASRFPCTIFFRWSSRACRWIRIRLVQLCFTSEAIFLSSRQWSSSTGETKVVLEKCLVKQLLRVDRTVKWPLYPSLLSFFLFVFSFLFPHLLIFFSYLSHSLPYHFN